MHLISRLRIVLTRIALKHLQFPVPLCLVGPDSALALCDTIAQAGIRRLLLITDGFLLQSGLLQPLQAQLLQHGVELEIFSDVEPDPGYELVLRGVEVMEHSQAEAVLAVGGGSSMDCAKAIVHTHANRCHPAKLTGLWLYALPRRHGLPLYAVPTTAGTGSEVTIAAVLSDKEAQTKKAIIDPKITPKMVALDARLTLNLPAFLTACTGMDALTHAIEASISTMATPETDQMARTACKLLLQHLPVAVTQGQQLQTRQQMLLASSLAGMAFTRAGVGYVHAFAHQLGALYQIPHGLANALLLPDVLELMLPACSRKLAALAENSGIGDAKMSAEQRSQCLIIHVRQLRCSLQIPSQIQQLCREDLPQIIRRAFAEAHGTYGVPRYLTYAEALQMLESLLPDRQQHQSEDRFSASSANSA
ncbi:iron-containing alcohol dehydrogenase [Rheinheimera marina]|uniref:Iron-containing alcohol dehydrogenase n=1 Tax=Rheinheimera marina TaxID=1774958 RepID=A0ABV9JM64_9GAMM